MSPAATETPVPTERRRLGGTTVEVSRLGLGTAPLGGMFTHVDDDDAHAAVRGSLDAGLSFIDTAPFYGHGTAERRVGTALRDVPRESYTISTKVGRLVLDDEPGDTAEFVDAPPSRVVFDFSADGVRRSLEASLDRLGLDRVDVVFVHDPDEHEDQAIAEAYPALRALRDDGVVGAIGVGMNQSRVPTRFVRETDCDVVLLAGRYTALDQSGADDLLPAALERGVSVVVGGPYNSGILADPRHGSTYDYATADGAVLARAQRLADVAKRHGVSLQALALQFPFRHPAVTAVLTGVRAVSELDANLAAVSQPIPPELWSDLATDGLLA